MFTCPLRAQSSSELAPCHSFAPGKHETNSQPDSTLDDPQTPECITSITSVNLCAPQAPCLCSMFYVFASTRVSKGIRRRWAMFHSALSVQPFKKTPTGAPLEQASPANAKNRSMQPFKKTPTGAPLEQASQPMLKTAQCITITTTNTFQSTIFHHRPSVILDR